MTKVLLYSGGMDSWLISKEWEPDIKLYINVGSEYGKHEIARLPKDVKVVDFPLLGTFELPSKHVPMRNLYFLMIATNYGDEVCLGATAGDGGKDKSVDFLERAEAMLRDLWNDKKASKDVSVEKRFAKMYKHDLLDSYLSKGGDVETVRRSTFSCYTPSDGQECFHCYPCFRKFALLYSRGCNYDKDKRAQMWDYVQRRIIPTAENGGYDGTYYTKRGDESKDLIRAVEALKKEFA